MDADERWDSSLWNSCVCAAAAAERRTYMDKGYKATCSIRKVVFRHVRLVDRGHRDRLPPLCGELPSSRRGWKEARTMRNDD